MNKEIKDILNELKNSIKEPATTEIDNFTEEAYEYPNFFVLDPTTNECKALYNYITNFQKENKKYKEVIDKLKDKTKENIENAKCEIPTLTIGDKAYYWIY